jgi:hypothetical protein
LQGEECCSEPKWRFDYACALQLAIFGEWNLAYPTVEFPTLLIYSLLIYHSLCAGLRFFFFLQPVRGATGHLVLT